MDPETTAPPFPSHAYAVIRLTPAAGVGDLMADVTNHAVVVRMFWNEAWAQSEADRLNAMVAEQPRDATSFYAVAGGPIVGPPADAPGPDEATAIDLFDDLIDLDDRTLQNLVRFVPGKTMQVALMGADPALQERVFANMSKRAAAMMREDMELLDPEVNDLYLARLAVARELMKMEEAVAFLASRD